MRILTVVSFCIALSAVLVAVLTPFYISYEKNNAHESVAKMNALNSKRAREYPKVGCATDHARYSSYSIGIATSSSIVVDDSYIKCDKNGYSLNGEALTQSEVLAIGQAQEKSYQIDEESKQSKQKKARWFL